MSRKNRDRTTGLPLPSPVVPASSICFTIQVPNALEYRTALKGALAELGKAWNWSQTEGEDNEDAYTAAELWRERVANATYILDCGETMSCADIAICITTNGAVRDAIASIVPTVPIDGLVYPPGVPLTGSQMNARLNQIDECAFDPYWAQVEQFVDYMIDLGQDILDQIALYNAALDAGENIPMGKFLGKIKNTSGGGKVLEFLQWVASTVKAAYEAADNAANRDDIKCAIFCQFRDDCLITIQGTLDVLNERLGGLLTPGDLDDLPAMLDAFMTATFNPTLALDLWLTFLMGSAKTAGMFGLQGIDETLQLVLEVAVNDANNDWETKCDECDAPVDPIIVPVATFGDYTGAPMAFLGNEGGGSRWRMTFTTAAGVTAIAVTTKVGGVNVCATTPDGSGTATSFQHELCGGGASTGAGLGVGTAAVYGPGFGWFGVDGQTIEILFVP